MFGKLFVNGLFHEFGESHPVFFSRNFRARQQVFVYRKFSFFFTAYPYTLRLTGTDKSVSSNSQSTALARLV